MNTQAAGQDRPEVNCSVPSRTAEGDKGTTSSGSGNKIIFRYLKMRNTINIFWALWNDILDALTGMDFKEIDTLSFTIVVIIILLIYYVLSKDRALDKKKEFLALKKKLHVTLELKDQYFIGQNKQQKEEDEGWRQKLEGTLDKRIQQFTDQMEWQGER